METAHHYNRFGDQLGKTHRRSNTNTAEPKAQQRRVDSKNDFKQFPLVVNKGALPVVSLPTVANNQSVQPMLWKPPAILSPPPAKPIYPQAMHSKLPDSAQQSCHISQSSEWTQHWDEEVGSHYYFNSSTGASNRYIIRFISSNNFQARLLGFARSDCTTESLILANAQLGPHYLLYVILEPTAARTSFLP